MLLGIRKTLLGVDVALDGRLVAADANESDLLRLDTGQARENRGGRYRRAGVCVWARQSAD